MAALPTKYNCSAYGRCEPSVLGRQTLNQCEATCQRSIDDSNNVSYEVYLEALSYDLDLALQATDSEQLDLVRRITGVRELKLSDVRGLISTVLIDIFLRQYGDIIKIDLLRDWVKVSPTTTHLLILLAR